MTNSNSIKILKGEFERKKIKSKKTMKKNLKCFTTYINKNSPQ
jgi:hypothetical protein